MRIKKQVMVRQSSTGYANVDKAIMDMEAKYGWKLTVVISDEEVRVMLRDGYKRTTPQLSNKTTLDEYLLHMMKNFSVFDRMFLEDGCFDNGSDYDEVASGIRLTEQRIAKFTKDFNNSRRERNRDLVAERGKNTIRGIRLRLEDKGYIIDEHRADYTLEARTTDKDGVYTRIAADWSHTHKEALEWFEVCLPDNPGKHTRNEIMEMTRLKAEVEDLEAEGYKKQA